jgi:hypothetical protein
LSAGLKSFAEMDGAAGEGGELELSLLLQAEMNVLARKMLRKKTERQK